MNPTSSSLICWCSQLGAADTERAGGKGANLGELIAAGLPVPPAFVVTADAFRLFLRAAGLEDDVARQIASLDVEDTTALRTAAEEMQARVLAAAIPERLRAEIRAAHRELVTVGTPPFLAVRSSATVEDMPGTSFAGMNETFLNVQGEEGLLEAVRRCWASLYGARVLFYRRRQDIPEERVAIAVVVQRMVDARSAGVMFTVNPANGDRRTIVIEGAHGLGDTVVGGEVSPDHWEVDRGTLDLTVERLAEKHVMARRGADGTTERVALAGTEAQRPSLSHEEVRWIAELGRQIEAHYGVPQDIEWAVTDDGVYIVQARPVTAIAGVPRNDGPGAGALEVLVRGLPASPGRVVGLARKLTSLAESDRLGPGEILVTRKTEPDWVPLMRRAAAIVTDEGGMTAHAAIVSRELGIPCVVGAQDATRRIADGTRITVDAQHGVVYLGAAPPAQEGAREVVPAVAAPAAAPVTGTRLYVNLAQPEMAESVAARDVDGVGLLRLEFIILAITDNTHPRRLLQEGRGDEFRDRLTDSLTHFARAFSPRPVVVRTTDFRTNEYRHMQGGAEFEPEEANPMIGYRGAYRYQEEPDLFRLELEAFRQVREREGLDNLILMLPFVRTLSELRRCRVQMDAAGLTSDPHFPLWIMAEVPSVLYHLPAYVREGVRGVSIGSNDLTQLMLGVDRDSGRLASLFDERDPAVLGAIRDIVRGCQEQGIPCSICGQAPSLYPELTEKLVEWGIDSVSVNPDVLERTRRILAAAEQRVLLRGTRERRAARGNE